MKQKHNITIRMGASKFNATVLHEGNLLQFDLYKASEFQRHEFRRTLVQAWTANRAKAAA